MLLLFFIHLVEYPFRHLFQEQITNLTLVYKNGIDSSIKHGQYPTNALEHTLRLFQVVKHLSISNLLSYCHSSLHIYYCSNLCKLNIYVNRFEDCLAFLDGRFKQLTTFIVCMNSHNYRISKNYNRVNLCRIFCD
jgi:hypothetical protein